MVAIVIVVAALLADSSGNKALDLSWDVLSEGCGHKSSDRRSEAVHALGTIPGNSRAEQMAEKALMDTSPDVRAEAATALGGMEAHDAQSKLHDALKDKQLKVVLAAANALYTLKDPTAYQVYYALLTGERKSGEGLLQTQLDTVRDRKQVEKLAFETGIGFVPFGGMGWQAWRTITADDSTPVKAAAAQKLASDPDPKSGQALVSATKDKKWRVRAAAANAIALRGDPKLMSALIPLLKDDEYNVCFQAAAGIIRLSQASRRRPGRGANRSMSSNSR